jgi:hypothetical protein
MKKLLLTILISILSLSQANATNQVDDILLFNNDTIFLYDSPLENYVNEINNLAYEYYNDIINSSGCHRGFYAVWLLINDDLFLSDVYQCETNRNINSIVERVFQKKYFNGLIKAEWVTSSYWAGKDLVPSQTLYISIFKSEFNFEFENGHLKSFRKHDFIPCEYSDDETIIKFVNSQLDWNKFSNINPLTVKISTYIQTDKTGKPIDVEIENSTNLEINAELKRVLLELPCLPVFFYKGDFWDVGESIDISLKIGKNE